MSNRADLQQLRRLLKKSTGIPCFEAKHKPFANNAYFSITEECLSDKPHITVYSGSWSYVDGGEYKISIYVPTLTVRGRNRINLLYLETIIENIRNGLNCVFGDSWDSCNEEQHRWNPLSRFSFYLQIPNFKE